MTRPPRDEQEAADLRHMHAAIGRGEIPDEDVLNRIAAAGESSGVFMTIGPNDDPFEDVDQEAETEVIERQSINWGCLIVAVLYAAFLFGCGWLLIGFVQSS